VRLDDGTTGTLDEWPVGPSRPEWTKESATWTVTVGQVATALWGAGLVARGVVLGLGARTKEGDVDGAGLRAQSGGRAI